jgi:hypothetical protein
MKDLLKPSVAGIGFRGIGNFTWKDKKANQHWNAMLTRCYRIKRGAVVCDEWHNFQNFAFWFEENYKEGYDLDKDLFSGNVKIYSPETCVFLPSRINNFLRTNGARRGSSVLGVTKRKHKGRCYEASCRNPDCVKISLGCYPTEEEAFSVYKQFKESCIKNLAEEYFNSGFITFRVYNAIINLKVTPEDLI